MEISSISHDLAYFGSLADAKGNICGASNSHHTEMEPPKGRMICLEAGKVGTRVRLGTQESPG